jgi:single-stranded-DNA-specific exonuclease
MKYRWSLASGQPALAARIAAQLRITPLLAQCLLNRSLSEPEEIQRFLDPRLKGLADPFLLPGMAVAVERLLRARQQNQPLVVFGDYDVDGVTSTALLLEVLSALGWNPGCYLPHRLDEGYGLSREGLENCLKRFSPALLLAVDCGSTSVESITWLGQRGIDVIVLDHHQVSSPPPPALALVNPLAHSAAPCPGTDAISASRENPGPTPAPFSELCSVGLAFKLAHALLKRGRETGLPGAAEFDLRPTLDLVALGTVADMVPLTGENRILVSAGLERLRQTRRPGLIALKKIARCGEALGVFEAGFQLAPRLNAAGRLETAQDALELLRAPDAERAWPLAVKLDSRNVERKKLERDILDQALALVRSRFNPGTDLVIVEGHALWHVGVVGIVAARILQQFYRPTIIVGGDGADWRGSGRSIAGFDLAAALRECGDLLSRHGGHAMAAGLTLDPRNIEPLRARLNHVARRSLAPETLFAPLPLDAEVGLEQITPSSLEEIARLEPLGQGNPAVQFVSRGLVHQRAPRRLGSEGRHVKMWVSDGKTTHEAIWWQAGDQPLPAGSFDLAFAPQIDEYHGRRAVLLKLLDWRPHQTPQI